VDCRGTEHDPGAMSPKPTFFRSAADMRAWLARHHAAAGELWVGYYKRASGRSSITWPESVDEALCYGWIDGVRKSIDDVSYVIRFTPRRPGSIWSAVNIRRAQALIQQGRMSPAGLRAYEARKENKTGIYSYEQRSAELEEPYRRALRKNAAAWTFFRAQPPSYRKAVSWWIVSAKREETRLRRVEKLIAYAAGGQTVPALTPRRRGTARGS
jgi:uncharacterized protein YdeI (YjbR/CyaY-like superfamily)